MVDSDVDNVTIYVLHALLIRDHEQQHKISDFALDILITWNIEHIIQHLRKDIDAVVTTAEYHAILEKGINVCNKKYLIG